MSKRIVVVGHGMVGQRFLESLTKDGPVTSRSPCSRKNRGWPTTASTSPSTSPARRSMTSRSRRASSSTRTASSCTPATRWRRSIAPHKRVTTKSGAEYEYDILVLATGSSPFVPPIPGRERPGVFVYRTIEDLEAITRSGQELHARRGHRRRTAGPRSREGAQGSGPRHQRRRVRAAAHGRAGGRGRRRPAAFAHRSARRRRAHRQEHHAHRRRRIRASSHAFRRRWLARNRRSRHLRRHPAARRTGARLRSRSGAAWRHHDQRRLPHLGRIHLRDRRMRGVRRPRVRSRGARLPDGAHRRGPRFSAPKAKRSPAPT